MLVFCAFGFLCWDQGTPVLKHSDPSIKSCFNDQNKLSQIFAVPKSQDPCWEINKRFFPVLDVYSLPCLWKHLQSWASWTWNCWLESVRQLASAIVRAILQSGLCLDQNKLYAKICLLVEIDSEHKLLEIKTTLATIHGPWLWTAVFHDETVREIVSESQRVHLLGLQTFSLY